MTATTDHCLSIDLHKRQAQASVINGEGEVVKEVRVAGDAPPRRASPLRGLFEELIRIVTRATWNALSARWSIPAERLPDDRIRAVITDQDGFSSSGNAVMPAAAADPNCFVTSL